uniref:Putative conserved secreted protein n=1 Tax=Ixodes scapularis TaxID=6945 RepID=A0A4D5RIW9_IXOSC
MGIHAPFSLTFFMFLWAMLLLQRAASGSVSRCEADKLFSCIKKIMQNPHMLFMEGSTELDVINSCNKVNDALTCTNEVIVDGCSEEVKRVLPTAQANFGLVRDTLCGKDVLVGIIEFNRCRDAHIMETCRTAARHHENQGSRNETIFSEDAKCRAFKTEFDCTLQATTGCPPAAQPGTEARKEFIRGLLALQRCPTLGDGGDAGSISAPWNSVILGALCSTLLYQLLYQAPMLRA